MFATLHEGWAIFEPFLKTYGAIAIFVMVYLESLGSPLPGETGVIAASLLASKGELSILTLYPAVLFAAILGDFTGYLIGRFGGRAVLRKFGPYIGLTSAGALDDRSPLSARRALARHVRALRAGAAPAQRAGGGLARAALAPVS